MAALNANSYYQSSQVTTASRGQLLLLAFDGMIRFLAEARRAMQEGNLEVQNTYMTKTQAILLELVVTLNHEVNPQLAATLERTYMFLFHKLVWANVHDDENALMEVAAGLHELRETWAEADRLTKTQEAMSGQQQGGLPVGGNAA